jgi:hypothetical protein
LRRSTWVAGRPRRARLLGRVLGVCRRVVVITRFGS